MILAIDTSTAACSAALFDADGACVACRDERIGRGHAERLVPMVAELLDGRTAEAILVGVGPGSFTGIRVGIAAAHGLAIGWGAQLQGMSSLALLAAAAARAAGGGDVAAAIDGGHGELFVQQFCGAALAPSGEAMTLPPAEAAARVNAGLVVGPAARRLVEARGWGEALEAWPSASDALNVPAGLRSLAARPVYGRAPDARVKSAA